MRRWLAVTCFFLSGAAGLIDEIVWIKRSALAFGSTTFALSTVLAVFFGGLALGSEIFGRIGRRIARPIRVYALLELAIAALVLLSLPAFGWLEGVYGQAYRALADGSGQAAGGPALLLLLRVLLVSVILLPPTIAMGGTLPLFVRQFVRSGDRLSGSVGFLYGVNTLGAAAGAAAAGFWLLPALGMQGSLVVAVVLNVVAGGLALSLKFDPESDEGSESTVESTKPDARLSIVAALFLLTGLAALAAEVVWTRFLSLVVRNSVTTYTLALTVVLLGIVLGSWLAARVWDRRLPLVPAYAALQIGAGAVLLVVTGLSAEFWRGLGQGIAPFVLLMLPPAMLSGASFPLAVKLATSQGGDAVRSVGRLAALNTLGGIVGSMIAGFWLLPALGLEVSMKIVTGLSVTAGVLALLLLDRPAGRAMMMRVAGVVIAVAAWAFIPSFTPAHLPHDYVTGGGHLIDVGEGWGSTLSVALRDGERQLYIDRLWQGTERRNHQIVAAHVPALLHPDPNAVLVVGLGVGQTASRFLMHDVERLDCVDIEPTIFPFVRRNFESAWMDDSRVDLVPDDGRTFVAHTSRTYDLISIEVGQVFRPGVDAFYTREFYAEAAERLEPGGLVAQFVPLPFLGETELRRIVATFLGEFPDAVLWYNLNELLLIGGRDGVPTLGADRLADLATSGALQSDLSWSHWGGTDEHLRRPAALLGGFLSGGADLHRLAADAALLVDDVPDLAYATMGADANAASETPLVAVLKAHLSGLTSAVAADLPEHDLLIASQIRDGNLRDLLAGAELRRVRGEMAKLGPNESLRRIRAALETHPGSRHARRMLGDVLNLAGRQAEAVPHFEVVLQREPGDREARRGLALSLSQTRRIGEAIPHLRRLLEEDARDAKAHAMLGACFADQGRFGEAAEHFRSAVMINPQDRQASEMLKRVERALGRQAP